MLDRNVLARNHGGHAAGQEHAGQCYNERLDAKVADQEALFDSEKQSDSQCNQHRQDYTHCPVFDSARLQELGAAHRGQADDTAHADVDASADHHNRQGASEDNQIGIIVQQVKNLLQRQEPLAKENHRGRVHDDENPDGDQHQQLGVRHWLTPSGVDSRMVHCHTPSLPAGIFLAPDRNRSQAAEILLFTAGDPAITIMMITIAL